MLLSFINEDQYFYMSQAQNYLKIHLMNFPLIFLFSFQLFVSFLLFPEKVETPLVGLQMNLCQDALFLFTCLLRSLISSEFNLRVSVHIHLQEKDRGKGWGLHAEACNKSSSLGVNSRPLLL